MQIQIRLSGNPLPLAIAHISSLPACHQVLPDWPDDKWVNRRNLQITCCFTSLTLSSTLLNTQWVKYKLVQAYFACFVLWGGKADYYMCIYDWAGWHAIPLSSLLTYSSASLCPPFLLLLLFCTPSYLAFFISLITFLSPLLRSSRANPTKSNQIQLYPTIPNLVQWIPMVNFWSNEIQW